MITSAHLSPPQSTRGTRPRDLPSLNLVSPLLQCGAVALQRRLHSVFPKPVFPNRIKDWQKSFFYCKDTSPAGEPRLPLFSKDRLEATPLMKARCSETARPKVESLIIRIQALLSHSLENMDLVRCWTTWRIQPLSPRTRLICTYTRCVGDDLRITDKLSDGPDVVVMNRQMPRGRLKFGADGC